MITSAYAQALERVLLKNSHNPEMVDKIIQNCIASLKRDGREKLIPTVLSETMRRMKRRGGGGDVLCIARAEDEADVRASLKKDVPKDIQSMGTTEVNRIRIDETLVGGYQFFADGRIFDKSFKKELLELYGALAD